LSTFGYKLSLETLPDLIFFSALKTLLVVLIPLSLLALACRLIGAIQNPRLSITPAIETASLLFGTLIGALLLHIHLPPGSLSVTSLFNPNSIWNISFERVLFDISNPLNYPILSTVSSDSDSYILKYLILVAGLVSLGTPIVINRGLRGIANGTRNVVILIWSVYVSFCLICILFWIFTFLNFWIFLIALIIIQILRR